MKAHNQIQVLLLISSFLVFVIFGIAFKLNNKLKQVQEIEIYTANDILYVDLIKETINSEVGNTYIKPDSQTFTDYLAELTADQSELKIERKRTLFLREIQSYSMILVEEGKPLKIVLTDPYKPTYNKVVEDTIIYNTVDTFNGINLHYIND